MITHSNLMANERALELAFGHTEASVAVGWLPAFHDMGLIGNILQPLYVGFPSILMSPMTFLRKPVEWLRAITKYKGTTSGAPDFAYDHCVRNITEDERDGLDLRSWAVAFNGGEPIRAETFDRFTAAFARYGFRSEAFSPCYGLAEATLFVSGGPACGEPRRLWVSKTALEAGRVEVAEAAGPGDRCIVSCGAPAPATKILAVDPVQRVAISDGSIGELWVSSPSVASGYWCRPGESESTFANHPANDDGPYLNTGDLGFLDRGEVFVTGRSKDLLIIRGRNIYPQDVEAVVERVLPSIGRNSCAAFSIEKEGQERLVVVVEADRAMGREARFAGAEMEAPRRHIRPWRRRSRTYAGQSPKSSRWRLLGSRS